MSASPLVTHGHATEAASGALPSLALAPGRLLTYRARGDQSRAIAARVLEIVATLPVTPTLRQVYYLLVSDGLIPKTEAAYKALGRQTVRMRKGGMLPYDALIDGTRDATAAKTFAAPSEALVYATAIYRRDLWATQPIVAEVWAEADTMKQMLWQVASPWGVTCVVTRGNPSLSLLYARAAIMARRLTRDQRTHIVYVGDWDPAGTDMSDNLHGRLLEVGAPAEAMTVQRVAVTQEQIMVHQLPSRPPKRGDTRTAAFIDRYGADCVEADALPPAVLVAVVEAAIKSCITHEEAWYWAEQQQDNDRRALRFYGRWFADEIDQHAREGERTP